MGIFTSARDSDGDLGRIARTRLLRVYYRVMRPIYITDTHSIEDSKQVRKMEVNEIFEVEEGPKQDASIGVDRVRGRALRDGSAGWVTTASNMNRSAPFLVHSGRYLQVSRQTHLRSSENLSEENTLRILREKELVELLDWVPGDGVLPPRLNVRAHEEGTTGWATMSMFEAI